MAFGLEASEAFLNDLSSFGSVAPLLNVDELAGLEVLVALEEVLDLVLGLLRNIGDVLDVLPAWVLVRNSDDLGIRARLVAHVQNADGTQLHANTGEDGVLEQSENVYGVTVEAESVLEVAVVGGVNERREQHAVEVDATCFVVNFVLVAASLGNFNDGVVSGHRGLLHVWDEYALGYFMMPERPRLTPAMADVRRAVRELLAATVGDGELVLVALSGGPDSLALAAATAFEAPRGGLRAGAVIVDHGLQEASAAVAEAAAEQARALGLDPVDIRRVEVISADGPEADARTARYAALDAAQHEHGAAAVLLGHTLDDQAETVLLGLTRGAGPTSLAGMSAVTGSYLRPLLGIRRIETVAACADQGLSPWSDPHNHDRSYTRVRIRNEVMPVLESQLGPGVSEALARTAVQLREDAAVLDSLARDALPTVLLPTPGDEQTTQVALDAGALADMPAAIHNRLIRLTALSVFGVSLSQAHTAAIAALVTNWHGQGEAHVPGIRVERQGFRLVFRATNPANSASAKE